MTRKQRLGCAGAVLGVLAVVGGVLYLSILRPAEKVLGDLDQMAALREKNTRLQNRGAFAPPVDGVLPETSLARFVRVQAALRSGIGSDYAVLADRAGRLHGLLPDASGKLQARRLGLREALLAMQGLGPVLARAKDLQVAALNAEGFSLAEYRWVRETFYRSLGFSRANVYFEEFAASLQHGNDPPPEMALPAPLEANRELTAAYSDSIPGWFPFFVFGL